MLFLGFCMPYPLAFPGALAEVMMGEFEAAVTVEVEGGLDVPAGLVTSAAAGGMLGVPWEVVYAC